MTTILTALYISAPVILAASLHMPIIRFNLFPGLRIPVHARAFGPNKTWRGFVMMPLLGAPSAAAVAALDPTLQGRLSFFLGDAGVSVWTLGFLLGLAYVLFELPNSYYKRRTGVAPGKRPGRRRGLYILLDHCDSEAGCMLVYWLLTPCPAGVLVMALLMGPVIHIAFNLLFYALRLRSEPL